MDKRLAGPRPAGGISRRSVSTWLGAAPLFTPGSVLASDAPWRVAQSTALSGPLGDLGTAISSGARAGFAEINAQGGVHGRPIELVTVDDAYDVQRALVNVDRFLADASVLALFNCMGTPAIAAMLPKVIASGTPFFAPFTGAQSVRLKGARNLLYVRASYSEESEKLTQHLATIGVRRIAIAFQDNAFGKEVQAGAQAAIDRYQLPAPAAVSVNADGSNLAAAVEAVARSNATALIVGLAGKPAIDFIKAMRSARKGLSIYALSVLGAAGTIRALGELGVGIAISQVVPSPLSALPIARDFRAAWTAAALPLQPSHLAFEGYINARSLVAVLQRAGPAAHHKAFIDAAWSLRRHDLGGFEISFIETGKGASMWVELTMIGKDGRLIR